LKALAQQLNKVQAEIHKENKVSDIRNLLSARVHAQLDKKQIKALQWMLDNPNAMTTKKYCKLGHCSDETARKDFNRLIEAGLIEQIGHGRATGYILKSKGA
jgi:predicted HTH transcriptional regulator